MSGRSSRSGREGRDRDRDGARDRGGERGADRGDRREVPRRREAPKIDREKVCPLLVRVFTQTGAHHRAEDFAERGKEPVKDEVQIYTWKDASLKELTELIKGVKSSARARNARLSFAFVYPGPQGKNVVRPVGTTYSQKKSTDDKRSLQTLRFETGDFLDVAIYPN